MHLNRAMKDINNRQKCLISTEPLQSTDLGADDDDDDAAVTLCYPLRMEPERDLQLVGSANGLVCLVFYRYHIILWNPCTGEAKELAKSTFVPKFPGYSYEPCFTFGLGYDSSIDDYKVVILENSSTYDDHDHVYFVETEGEVFTLKTNSWRRIQDIPPSACMCNGGGIFSNGSLHWLLDWGNGHEKFNSIISFDLAPEKFQEVVPLPDHDVKMGLIKDVRVLRGCLSALYCYDNNFEIWVMKEYRVKESWTKLATISCEKATPYKGLPDYQNWLYPLWFSKNDEVLMDVGGLELVMYNLKEETFRKLPLYGQNWYILETVMYVESLVSPNCNNGTDKQRQGQRKRRKKMKNWGDRDAKEFPRSGLFVMGFSQNSLNLIFGLGYDSSIDDYKVVTLICNGNETKDERCLISTEPLQSIDIEAADDDADAAKLLNCPLTWELQLVGSARGLVVRLTRDGNSNNHLETKGEVYSLKTNSWKRIQNIHPSARLLDGHGIFLNGALHWLVNYGNATLSFDLATEKFQEVVPLPDCDVRTRPIGDIGVLGGCLSLCYRNGNYLELWEMKEYGVKASWTKSVTISLEKLLPDKKPPYHNRWSPLPLCFSKNGEVLMNVDGTELIMYNLKEETFRKLSIHGQNWNTLETVIYVESLVSPKDISGAEKRLQGQQKSRKQMDTCRER
ncbi:hypothetical protein L1049_016285 [Liquidambar formosana]|uniref:F-box associated beta-propeller type 1 domain-containing protein n=1 Tax=Liquidambar formosana TaxID=63359 RepID=A0AAP0X6Q0_LIQFO